jgi:hypothetical protein
MRLIHAVLAFMTFDMMSQTAKVAGIAARADDHKALIFTGLFTVVMIFASAHCITVALFGRIREPESGSEK